MLKKKRFLIGGIIVFAAIGYLAYVGLAGSATYFYTVNELMEQGSSVYGERVRVNGQVSPGSVQREATERTLRFTIVDEEVSLPVFYQGTVPDSFQVGNDVVIEGHLDSTGVFQAHTLMPTCPSKYVPLEE